MRYDKTASGVGNANQIVQFSSTAGHTKSDTATFAAYGVENNLEFGLQATLGPGWLSNSFHFLHIKNLQNDMIISMCAAK